MDKIDTREIIEFAKAYEIADAHTHIFPDKIAEKATGSISEFYHLQMDCNCGNTAHLLESGKKIGVKWYLVCSTATTPSQVVSINNFIMEQCRSHPEFIGFGTLHPDYDDPDAEIQRCIEGGLKGIKLHPDFQQFYIDEDRAFRMYEAIRGRLPILMHMGDNRYDFSRPKRLENVVNELNDLTVFAAHLGGYERWEEAVCCLYSDNVYFDTSSSLEFISPSYAKDIIRGFGADKVFFGTDFPMWDHTEELGRFMALGLSETENRKILSENLKRQFSLSL